MSKIHHRKEVLENANCNNCQQYKKMGIAVIISNRNFSKFITIQNLFWTTARPGKISSMTRCVRSTSLPRPLQSHCLSHSGLLADTKPYAATKTELLKWQTSY